MEAPRFPLFVPLEDQPVLVVGGGGIALRRIRTLLAFGARVTVISPALCPGLAEIQEQLQWRREEYASQDLAPYFLAIAVTDSRVVNRQVGRDAHEAGVLVSVADCKEESTFWFPAVVQKENLVMGIVSTDGDHKGVKEAAERLRCHWGESVECE